jgi:hypothetical protein
MGAAWKSHAIRSVITEAAVEPSRGMPMFVKTAATLRSPQKKRAALGAASWILGGRSKLMRNNCIGAA